MKAFSVCKIRRVDGAWGSGFHLGNGWVVTNSHVLNSRIHVNGATFQFTTPNGDVLNFESHERFGFRYRINEQDPNGNPVPDLAMVKLGMQYQYGGVHQPEPWEIAEQSRLSSIPYLVRQFARETRWVVNANGNPEIQHIRIYAMPTVGQRANAVHVSTACNYVLSLKFIFSLDDL